MPLLLVLWPLAVLAVPPSALKAADQRRETSSLVAQVVKGSIAVPTAVSRLRILRQEPYAAGLLANAIPNQTDPRRIRDIAAVLAGIEARGSEPVLVQLAEHEDGAVRMYAAQGLGKLHSKQVGVLLPLLEDKSFGVRREAARALGASRNPRVGKALFDAARTESDPQTRVMMLEAVGASGDKGQAANLKSLLEDSSESTRFSAARALCLLGSPEGFAFARKLLASEDKLVRRQGLALFEGVPQKLASPVLKPLLEDADHAIGAGAARILYQCGDKTMLAWLVVTSANAQGSDKLLYENELETLHLADADRAAILRRAGLMK